jgi:hypothetical protein
VHSLFQPLILNPWVVDGKNWTIYFGRVKRTEYE